MTLEQKIRAAKFLLGGLAAVASFLLVQSDVVVPPLIKVALGAFLAFAAYVDPALIVTRSREE